MKTNKLDKLEKEIREEFDKCMANLNNPVSYKRGAYGIRLKQMISDFKWVLTKIEELKKE
ncbi:MAG: hypothetical protein KKB31_00780 [Nanoarchaeota archaeon]|nr:hypothetical protein [Nanoarchaeota archaeon]